MVQLLKAPRAALSSLGEWTVRDVIKYAILAQIASVLVPAAIAGIYILGEGRFLPVVESGQFVQNAGDYARGIQYFTQLVVIAIDLALLLIWLVVMALVSRIKNKMGKAQIAAATVYGATPVIVLTPWILSLPYLLTMIPALSSVPALFLVLLFFLLLIHILTIYLQVAGLRKTTRVTGGRAGLIVTIPIVGMTALFALNAFLYVFTVFGLLF